LAIQQVVPELDNAATNAPMATPMEQIEEEEQEPHVVYHTEALTEPDAEDVVAPKPRRKLKTCKICRMQGHDIRTRPEHVDAPTPVAPLVGRPVVNQNDSDVESVTSSANDSDSSDDEIRGSSCSGGHFYQFGATSNVIAQYNRGMGGTDLGDQKLYNYCNAMRSAK
jgi:hypothetical protein